MKKILLFITGAFLLASCEDMVQVEPVASIDAETALVDSIDVDRSALGVYSSLQSNNYYGLRYLLYQDVYADNLQHSGSFTTDREVTNRRINPSNLQISTTWSIIYTAINRANTLIKRIDDVPMLEVNKNRYRAEMRLLRALCYFDLVKVFGGVPLALTPTIDVASIKNLPRSTEAQVYDQIITDLIFAETTLGNSALPIARRPNRASGYTAAALLSRVYLQKGDNLNAGVSANKVITANVYALQASYSTIFSNENTTESILELDFSINDQNGLADASNPQTGGQKFYLRAPFYTLMTTASANGDRRSQFSAGRNPGNTRNRNLKYFRLTSNDDNVPIIRYAEMFLTRAEARARQGVPAFPAASVVISDINVIRTRAGLSAIVLPLSNSEALTEILAQRRIEFAFEGQRFPDLKRYGLAASTLFPAAEAYRVLWPIPLTQITASDKVLTQNPGY